MSELKRTSSRGGELGIAMVGFGRRANEHLDAIERANLQIRIRAVCELDPDVRGRVRRRLPGTSVVSTPEAMAMEGVELIVICLPPSASRGFVENLITPGLRAILVEKPAAVDSESARQWFGEISVPVFVFHQTRLLPWISRVDQWLSEVRAGNDPIAIEGFCRGTLFDQGLHLLDLVSRFMASLPDHIQWVTAESEPARISAREPLPADWRIDGSHPGPLAIEVTAAWKRGGQLRIACGPTAARDWLDKRLVFTAGDKRHELGTKGVSTIPKEERFSVEGSHDDYIGATAEVYRQCHRWIKADGPEPQLPGIEAHIQMLKWAETVLKHGDRDRFERPFWIDGQNRPLPILIVIPLSDHRGIAEHCVTSWMKQDGPADEFQVVLVSNLATAELGESLRPRLRAHDRIIQTGFPPAEMGQGDMDEYVVGIESSESEWIFLTEPHCEVPPDTVAELKRFFETSEAAGFCTECVDRIVRTWGKMEALYSAAGFDDWREEGHWAKMIMRGFGIRRAAYDAAGGVRVRYGRFAEWLLAADLHRKGLYLAVAPSVQVIHYYTPDKRYLDEAIEEFVIGQVRYLAETPEEKRLPYFPTPAVTQPRDPHLERLFARARSEVRIREMAPGNRFLSGLSRSNRLWLAREFNAAMVWTLAGWIPSLAFPFFIRYYEAQNQRCLLKHLPRFLSERRPVPLRVGETWTALENSPDSISGMNGCEKAGDSHFRWSESAFAIPVEVPRNRRVTLDILVIDGLIEINPRKLLALPDLPDAEPLFPEVRIEPDQPGQVLLRFRLPDHQESWRGRVAVVGSRFHARKDPRDLGLPIAKIFLKSAGTAAEEGRETDYFEVESV